MTALSDHPRITRQTLDALERLPVAALPALVERLIDRLDAAEPDPDCEPDDDDLGALEDELMFPRKRRSK